MVLKNVHAPIPGTCEQVLLKEKGTVQVYKDYRSQNKMSSSIHSVETIQSTLSHSEKEIHPEREVSRIRNGGPGSATARDGHKKALQLPYMKSSPGQWEATEKGGQSQQGK